MMEPLIFPSVPNTANNNSNNSNNSTSNINNVNASLYNNKTTKLLWGLIFSMKNLTKSIEPNIKLRNIKK
jgi:hypothetical protein